MTEQQSLHPDSVKPDWMPRIHHHFRLQWEQAQDAFVLLYPEGMVKLNASAGEILSYCDGENSVQSITEELSRKYPEADGIEQDIREFIAEAFGHQWLKL